MTSNYTPGPWGLYFNSGDDFVVRKMFPDGSEAHVVARVQSGAANARLIAAAPETAAKAMEFTLLVEGFLRDDTGAEAVTEEMLTTAMYALRAHIAKATGAPQ